MSVHGATPAYLGACEACWADAFMASKLHGGHQVDHYLRLLRERDNDPEHVVRGAEAESMLDVAEWWIAELREARAERDALRAERDQWKQLAYEAAEALKAPSLWPWD